MLINNNMRHIRYNIYKHNNMIDKNSIVYVHGINTYKRDNEKVKEVKYDAIVKLLEKFNKGKTLHLVVNDSIARADKVKIRIENL